MRPHIAGRLGGGCRKTTSGGSRSPKPMSSSGPRTGSRTSLASSTRSPRFFFMDRSASRRTASASLRASQRVARQAMRSGRVRLAYPPRCMVSRAPSTTARRPTSPLRSSMMYQWASRARSTSGQATEPRMDVELALPTAAASAAAAPWGPMRACASLCAASTTGRELRAAQDSCQRKSMARGTEPGPLAATALARAAPASPAASSASWTEAAVR
mmetsp:Transcript_5957/g.17387  ORF Transcript_5957/g.17387 Transcript_5957/m.17387 type:complete len:215 (+) Transcript_5957:2180-2824(+)